MAAPRRASARFRAVSSVLFPALAFAGCAVGSAVDPAVDALGTEAGADAGAKLDASQPLPAPSSTGTPDAAPLPTTEPPLPDPDGSTPPTPEPSPGATLPSQGEVVVSEVMFNPSGTEPDAEWFELHNTTTEPRVLGGLVLRDGASPTGTHTLPAGLEIAPKAFVVLAAKKSAVVASGVPATAIVHEYGSALSFGNSANGALVLLRGSAEIARARYGALGLGSAANGQSVQLGVLTWAGSGLAGSWCRSAASWPGAAVATDKGTPGAAPDCP